MNIVVIYKYENINIIFLDFSMPLIYVQKPQTNVQIHSYRVQYREFNM